MKNKSKRVCQVCGKPFYGSTDCHYCPECAKIKRSDTVVKIRGCKDCGVKFFGGPRARRCPDCAYLAQLETKRRYNQRGTVRPIGSIDNCAICGKDYIVNSSRQKYCSATCQRKGVLEWQREHKRGYNKLSGQDIKKQERRKQVQKICVYCLRTFTSDKPTNLCSDYCRKERAKMQQCLFWLNKGRNRNYDKYIDKRNKYREDVKNGDKKEN